MNDTMHNLAHQVESTIMEDPDLQDYEIDVLDSNGIITLRGMVPTRAAHEKAEAIAREVEGVTSVINELDVI